MNMKLILLLEIVYEYEADTLTGECQYEISISDLLSYHTYYFNPDTKLSCRCAGE